MNRFARSVLLLAALSISFCAHASFTAVTAPFSQYHPASGGDGAGQTFIGNIENVQAGDLIVWQLSWAGATVTPTISDGSATSWECTNETADANQRVVWCYTLASAASGDPTYTVTYDAARSERRYQAWHYRPSATPSFGALVGANGSSDSPSSGSLTVSCTDCLVFGGVATWNINNAAGTSPTIGGNTPSVNLGTTSHYLNSFAYATGTGFTGAAATTLSGSDAWVATALYFRIGGGGGDGTPNAFSFTDQTDVGLSTQITSAAVTIDGIDVQIECTATGGTIDVNEDDDFQASRDIVNNDQIRARHISSGSNSTATNTLVTCGGVSDTFTSTTEAAEDITATKLIFGSQPGNITVGQVFGAFTVRAVNDEDALDEEFTGDVTIALQTGEGSLGGTLTQSASAGIATFDDVYINTLNSNAVIRATTSGLTAADSSAFDVTAGGEGGTTGFPSASRLGGMLQ